LGRLAFSQVQARFFSVQNTLAYFSVIAEEKNPGNVINLVVSLLETSTVGWKSWCLPPGSAETENTFIIIATIFEMKNIFI
jgi:hypothetical protein